MKTELKSRLAVIKGGGEKPRPTQLSFFEDGESVVDGVKKFFRLRKAAKEKVRLWHILCAIAEIVEGIKAEKAEAGQLEAIAPHEIESGICSQFEGMAPAEAKKYLRALDGATAELFAKLRDGAIADTVFIAAAKTPMAVQAALVKLERIREKDVKDAKRSEMSAKVAAVQQTLEVEVNRPDWKQQGARYLDNFAKTVGDNATPRMQELIDELRKEHESA